MAGNMFDKMLQRNCHGILVVLTYAFLEWTLILLLFLNSLFSFLTSTFADYFGLHPFCTLCCHRIWHSKPLLCQDCSLSDPPHDRKICCDDAEATPDHRTDFECSDDPFWNEDESTNADEFICIELNSYTATAEEAMAMITKLQEEKAAIRMEALEVQRMMEEQAGYDQEALQLLNNLIIKREKEKQELQKEVEAYRDKLLFYEARERISSSRIPAMPAEFGNQRLSILEEFKAVETKLFALHDNQVQTSEDDRNSEVLIIKEELSNAFERLQDLETDMEFLKHCISSMTKGNDGLILLQEILQHLRGLRSVDVFPARNLDD